MSEIDAEIEMRLQMIQDLEALFKIEDLPASVRHAIPESLRSHKEMVDRLKGKE